MAARYSTGIVVVAALLLILTGCSRSQGIEYPKAEMGCLTLAGGISMKKRPGGLSPTCWVLDLSGWDFDNKGQVNLDGEWEFYWNQLLELADFRTKQPMTTR